MENDPGAGLRRQSGRVVPRTVVHDHDVGEVAANGVYQGSDGLRLVQTRNNGDIILKPIHAASLAACRT